MTSAPPSPGGFSLGNSAGRASVGYGLCSRAGDIMKVRLAPLSAPRRVGLLLSLTNQVVV
jgi:hypothetical protein